MPLTSSLGFAVPASEPRPPPPASTQQASQWRPGPALPPRPPPEEEASSFPCSWAGRKSGPVCFSRTTGWGGSSLRTGNPRLPAGHLPTCGRADLMLLRPYRPQAALLWRAAPVLCMGARGFSRKATRKALTGERFHSERGWGGSPHSRVPHAGGLRQQPSSCQVVHSVVLSVTCSSLFIGEAPF